jgi:hypothetical protein
MRAMPIPSRPSAARFPRVARFFSSAPLALLVGAAIALAACGGPAENTSPNVSPQASGEGAERQNPKANLRGDLRNATVYDAQGNSRGCGPIETTCPPIAPDLAFQDQCRLAGFQVRQCGCDVVCSGNIVKKPKQYYDASGNPSACDDPDPSCNPPAASAAFQDACIEKGHHLKTCGCSWLCSGNPVK